VIFVDTNVFMYAVGRPHPLKEASQAFFRESLEQDTPLCTSAEVLQELLHAYLPVRRGEALEAAMTLVRSIPVRVWPLEADDVHLARELQEQFPELQARDLCHLASCRRRSVTDIKTFDQALSAVLASLPTSWG